MEGGAEMSITRSGVLMTLGLIMLAGAALIGGRNWSEDRAGALHCEAVLEELQERSAPGERASSGAALPVGASADETTVTVDGERYCGVVKIPKIGVDLPVAADYSAARLRQNVCRYRGTLVGGDMILCAHNTRPFFARLYEVFEGDTLCFVDGRGVSHELVVSAVETIDGQAMESLLDREEAWDLSLFTCTPGGRMRYVVRCRLV